MAIRDSRATHRSRRPIVRGRIYGRPPTAPHKPPPPPPGPDEYRDIIGPSSLNALAGVWLIIAPWVLGYGASDPTWNDVLFGAIVLVLALLRVSGAYREAFLSWINAAIGVWLVIAAFTIDRSVAASVNDIVLGVIVLCLALASADATLARFGPRRPL